MRSATIKYIFIGFFVFLYSNIAFGQDIQKVCAEYVYVQHEYETLEDARRKAIENAKIQALANKFGTFITRNNFTSIDNAKVSFMSLGSSEVKGEWIEDDRPPEFEFSIDPKSGLTVMRVSVCGRAREIISAGVEIETYLLRNGVKKKFESDNFKHGDDYFVWFKSPVSGFLTIYLMDESENAFRLLPYSKSLDYSYKVEPDREYIFFSGKMSQKDENVNEIDEYIFTAANSIEYNRIYMIFSPNNYFKAPDNDGDNEYTPRKLSFNNFQKWLTKNRNRDKEMRVIIKEVEIKKQ